VLANADPPELRHQAGWAEPNRPGVGARRFERPTTWSL